MIKKIIPISLLAFFVLGAFLNAPLNAQDTITLDNGLKAVIKEDHRNPLVVFSVFIDSGSASEDEYAGTGISHLIEHMLFKGTRKYPAGSIEDILNRYGGDIEAYTSYDYTGYSIIILKEHLDTAIDVLKEMLTAPVFDAKELKKEMAVIEREMDMGKDDPDKKLSRMTFETAFLAHPYRIPAIGYKENFIKLTKEDLVKFFKAHYAPEKMTVSVVGDIGARDALDKIKMSFGTIPRGNNTIMVRPKEPPQAAERFLEETADIDGAYMNLSFRSTGLLDDDLYAMDLLAFIMGQGESSILNENLRMKDQLVLSVSAYNYTPKDPGLFIISSVLKEENTPGAINAILSQIENLKQAGVSQAELLKAKNNFIADYVFQKETIEAQANDMAQSQLLTGSPDFFKQYVENIKAVTPEDIKQAASKYLNRHNMTVTILSKSGKSIKKESDVGLEKEKEDVRKVLLSNGIPLIISENHSLPVIAVSILFKGGLRIENENNNGISMLSSRMLMDGTSSMSRSEIARFYESKAISLGAYSGNNSAGINITCLKEHIEDALKLASDICANPVFPEEEFRREKTEMIEAIKMQDNELINHGHRLLKEMLFKIHPYRFQATGTQESIDKITRDEVKDFYKKIASLDNIAIGVSGDFQSLEMQGLVEKYFSKISRNKSNFSNPSKEPAIEKTMENSVQTDKNQSLVLVGFRGIDIYDKDKYAVEILANILSNSSGVLFKTIRGEKGLAYAVGAFNVLGIDPGYLAIYGLTSKQNIGKVKDGIFRELEQLRRNGVKKEDIEKSKNYIKAMRKVGMQSNSSFIFSITMDELYGLGYDDYKNFDKNIDAVRPEDIKAAAKRILTLDKCAVLILQRDK
ncbi:MAG: insulinase family protein [Candidatus Omnitrophica bacterium]|nr:insulinase family protein [Candidatus Omnitrophota bacterium]